MTNPILERLSEDNPEALIADGFDSAVIGVGYQSIASQSVLRRLNPREWTTKRL